MKHGWKFSVYRVAGLWAIAAVVFTCGRSAADERVLSFLKQHCTSCHGEKKQQANLRLDQLQQFRAEDQHLWTEVHSRIRDGEMPPEEQPQPAATEIRRVLDWIETQQQTLEKGGARRLNRREYSAALQHVTGLPVDYAAALPADGKVSGFDTGATALQDSASSVDQTLLVTRRAVDALRFLEEPASHVFAADLRDEKDIRKAFDPWKAQGASPKPRGTGVPGIGLLMETQWVGDKRGMEMYVPAPEDKRGLLKLTLEVAVQKYFDGMPDPHLWVNVGSKAIDYRQISASPDKPQKLVYVIQLEDVAVGSKGIKIALQSKVETPYAVKGFKNEVKSNEPIPGGGTMFRPEFDKKQRDPKKRPVPYLVLQSIEIEPGYVAAWPPEAWNTEFNNQKLSDDDATAGRLLQLWTRKAWRQPVSEDDTARFFALYKRLRSKEFSFDEALRAAFHAVLMSPEMRYLRQPDEKPSGFEIASRLSFMLWGAPPDEELLKLAAAGKLRDGNVLDAQVERLLADERSAGFFEPFVRQWLELEQPITVVQDHIGNQDFRFGRHLKESMKAETIQYVAACFRENRPARELLDSDWTLMNESLAVHYGYENIHGAALQKVKLRRDDKRGGGLLSHAGIQSMLCWMGDNWVIYRGAWTLRHILDDPPPPPPLEVPELDPSANENKGKSFRELLVQHQEDAKCTVCHKKMDPLGFAFQNFDVGGRWRELEYESYQWGGLDGKKVWNGKGKSRPVDAQGQLPRGEPFSSYAEFKQKLADGYTQDLVRGLLKNLLLYGAGRKAGVSDMATIRDIMDNTKQHRLGDMLKALVRSEAFLGN